MPIINGKYYTEEQLREIRQLYSEDEFNNFLISGVIGAVSGSALLGGLLGGSFTGGIIGDLVEGTDDSLF